MEAETTESVNTSDTLAAKPQLTVPFQERLKGPASQAGQPVTKGDVHRAKAMPFNQYASLGSTASEAGQLVSQTEDIRRANVMAFNRFVHLRLKALMTGQPVDMREFREIRDIGKAKVRTVNQFAHLDSTAVAETATSTPAYREPDIPASPTQHQAELKAPKQQRVRDYSQQLTLQVASGSNSCMENKQLGGFIPKTVPTKLKTTTPDTDKNDEYYEKRKRNNIAARKSRENKRSIEEEIKKKVSIMEKENASLLQEITKIKKRYGLSLGESVMTPEERNRCDIEINLLKTHTTKASKNPGMNDVSSGPDLQSDVEQLEEDSDRPQEHAASSATRVNKEDASPRFTYGPPIYGPYSPSPCWPPVIMQHPYIPVQKYPLHAGHGNSVVPVDCFVNRSMGVFMPPPYRHYLPFENQGNQMLYGPDSVGRSSTNAAPNLNMIRSKGHNEEMGISAKCSSDDLNMRVGRTGGSAASATQPFFSSTEQENYMGDAPAMSSSEQEQRQFCGPFKVPLPITPSRNSKPAETVQSSGQDDKNTQHAKVLRQQSKVLIMARQSLSDDMQQMTSKMRKGKISE